MTSSRQDVSRSAYSSLKIFHHQLALEALRQGKITNPIHVQLIPTNRCNQSCSGCAYRLKGYSSNQRFDEREELEWPKLEEIVEDCSLMGVRSIELTGGGEPTLHPQFLPLAETILDSAIDLGLVTNGTRWTPEHSDVLSRAKWVRFSLDASRAETYSTYRKANPLTLAQVRKNVRAFVDHDRVKDSLIGIGFVVNNRNWTEVVEAAEAAKEDGVDNFRISALFQPQGYHYFDKFFVDAKELCLEAEKLSTDTFHVFNLFTDRLRDLFEESPEYTYCGYSKLTTYLGADGRAYTCCMNAYNDRGFIGSFREQSFQAMWYSAETQARLRNLNATGCPSCMYNQKNRAILYAIDPSPPHVNFV